MPNRALFSLLLLSILLLSSGFMKPLNASDGNLTSVTILAEEDSYLREDKPGHIAGAEDYLLFGYEWVYYRKNCKGHEYQTDPKHRYVKIYDCDVGAEVLTTINIVLHFPFEEKVPPGAILNNATLILHVYRPENKVPVRVYGLTERFDEEYASWVNRLEGEAWSKRGGSHERRAMLISKIGSFAKEHGFYRFNVTDYYSRVLRGEIEDYGILIQTDRSAIRVSPPSDIWDHRGFACDFDVRQGWVCPKPADFHFENRVKVVGKFHSKDWAINNNKTVWAPQLLLYFFKPNTILTTQPNVTLLTGESVTLSVLGNGSYRGPVRIDWSVDGPSPDAIRVDTAQMKFRGPTYSFNLTLTADEDAEEGLYRLTLTPIPEGYEGLVDVQPAEVEIFLTKGAEPTFMLTTQDSVLTLKPGGRGEITFEVVSLEGFAEKVNLSVKEAPSWASVTIEPSWGTPDFSGSVHVEASSDAPQGVYNITIAASGGGIEREGVITVKVLPSPSPGGTATSSPLTSSSPTETSPPPPTTTSSASPPTLTVTEEIQPPPESEGGLSSLTPILLGGVAAAAAILALTFMRRRG